MTPDRPEERDLSASATALADLARDLLGRTTVQATLERIVAASVDLVEGCSDAGILVVHQGQGHVLAASSPLARECEEMEARLAEGPCFEAARSGTPVLRITDLATTDERWPNFVSEARRLGAGSALAFLLYTDRDDPQHLNLGSLNLYAREPGAFTDLSEKVGWLLASHAAVALAGARAEEGLHTAIASRQVIGQAVGILMERHKITSKEAFGRLTRASQHHNVKLRRVAEELVATGELIGSR